MALAACFVLLVPSALSQVSVIGIAALIGLALFKPEKTMVHDPLPITIRRRVGFGWLALFFALLIGLPLFAAWYPNQILSMVDTFFRAGSLVFSWYLAGMAYYSRLFISLCGPVLLLRQKISA